MAENTALEGALVPSIFTGVVVKVGRPMPGFGECRRCRGMADNRDMVMVADPGKSKGVWWCHYCANLLRGPDDRH